VAAKIPACGWAVLISLAVASWCWWGWHDDHARIAKIEARDKAIIANRDDWLRFGARELQQAADLINTQNAAVRNQAKLGQDAQHRTQTALEQTTRDRASIDRRADAVRALAPPTGAQTKVEKAVLDLGDL
jgi:hypothetical protein